MSFFNKKQEVIDIQLTKHGRELLLKGAFKPVYYSFHDADVIYDVSYADNLTESQNYTISRVLEESPLVKIIPNFQNSKSEFNKIPLQRLNNILGQPIGTSDPNSEYAPAWSIDVLNGAIGDVEQDSINKNNCVLQNPITQINLSSSYTNIIIDKVTDRQAGTLYLSVKEPGDSSRVSLEQGSIILSVEEQNSIDIGENFDIEVFIIPDSDNEELIKLNFYQSVAPTNNRKIIDGILQDEFDSAPLNIAADIQKQKDNVDNYFFIQIDDEIPTEELKIDRLSIYDKPFNNGNNC